MQQEDIQQEDSQQKPQEESSTDELQNEDVLLRQKIQELEDQYLRAYADFENVKKRLEKDKSQALEYANQNILKDMLPVADTLEKALESAQSIENGEKIAEGLKLTIDNLHKVFSKYGVEVIEADSEFNPELHDAIMQVQDPEKDNGQIAQVLQKGYIYKERTLRAAMVSIVKN
ncbi:nucleotide exchange factor GrpE [Helicobacter aurati]|uniref:Protein GrpE n=1 Tax=Helicobacter aurati TaxID=137778 RepID=A0A3D8J3C1_9HELI|nr:nucleotide exchange factor GrpE [Helicobacter aurati]RDU71261.1 nucleotide exchange factor GrpE [Helicobacter aurati]